MSVQVPALQGSGKQSSTATCSQSGPSKPAAQVQRYSPSPRPAGSSYESAQVPEFWHGASAEHSSTANLEVRVVSARCDSILATIPRRRDAPSPVPQNAPSQPTVQMQASDDIPAGPPSRTPAAGAQSA